MDGIEQLPLLEKDQVLKQLNARHDLWLQLVGMFMNEVARYTMELKVSNQDADALYASTHHLKSSSAYLCLPRLHWVSKQLCESLQRTGESEDGLRDLMLATCAQTQHALNQSIAQARVDHGAQLETSA